MTSGNGTALLDRGTATECPRRRLGKAAHQLPRRRRQPAHAAEIRVGLGALPQRLRQPLDADRGGHGRRHRPLEERQAERRRAPGDHAQPRLLRHRREPGRQQHHPGPLSPRHQRRVPPVPAAAGVRGGDPHPHLPLHRGEPGAGRARSLRHVPRDPGHRRQGRAGDGAHRGRARTRISRPRPSPGRRSSWRTWSATT